MNSKILSKYEKELSSTLLRKEHKILREDTTIILEDNCKLSLTILEDISLTFIHKENVYTRIEISLEKNKHLNLTEVIVNNNSKYKRKIHQESNSSVNVSQLIFGGSYIKTTSFLKEKSTYSLVSAYLCLASSLILLNSVTHLEKTSQSHLLINGAGRDSSTINNDGIITILPQAFGSSGHQKIKNILLDSTTKINSEPILEIQNHDVRCSHGASTSSIDDETLTYFKSRGINDISAQKLILEGFFEKALLHTNQEFSLIENYFRL